jgi:hypothetical protein
MLLWENLLYSANLYVLNIHIAMYSRTYWGGGYPNIVAARTDVN